MTTQEEYSIFKSNLAIQSQSNLTNIQQKIFNQTIYLFKKNGWNKTFIFFSNVNLNKYGADNRKFSHKELKKIFKGLLTNLLELVDNEKLGEYEATGYLSSVQINRLVTKVNMDISLKNLLDVNYVNEQGVKNTLKGYTKLDLNMVERLDLMHSIPIYELLKCKSFASKKVALSFEYLYKMFGEKKNSYKNFGEFNRRILTPCIEEINFKTDLKIKFELIKESNKVVDIKFYVAEKSKKELGAIA